MSQNSYRRNRLTRGFLQIGRTLLPATLSLACAGVAHTQGTMDFSGAQTLMGTFKTTVLKSVREAAEKRGYVVEGFHDERLLSSGCKLRSQSGKR